MEHVVPSVLPPACTNPSCPVLARGPYPAIHGAEDSWHPQGKSPKITEVKRMLERFEIPFDHFLIWRFLLSKYPSVLLCY